MGTVLVDVTISLDGFLAGPDISVEHPLGKGGERLHQWMYDCASNEVDSAVAQEMSATLGATIVGKRIFDVGRGPWGGTPFSGPCYVLTHHGQDELVMHNGTFIFVTDGPESALKQARAAAGAKNVAIMGADITQQYLKARLIDEMHVHIAPVLLGEGKRLFEFLGREHIELEQIANIASTDVTHLRYRVAKR